MGKLTVGIKNKTALKKNVTNINTYMIQLANELQSLSANVNAMMIGNTEGPYWNGNKAMRFYKKAIGNLENNIKDYESAYNRLQVLAVTVDSATKQDI